MTDLEPRPVLALNSGSSSLKFGLYRVGPVRTEELLSGEAEAIGEAAGKFSAQNSPGERPGLRNGAHSDPARSGHPRRAASG